MNKGLIAAAADAIKACSRVRVQQRRPRQPRPRLANCGGRVDGVRRRRRCRARRPGRVARARGWPNDVGRRSARRAAPSRRADGRAAVRVPSRGCRAVLAAALRTRLAVGQRAMHRARAADVDGAVTLTIRLTFPRVRRLPSRSTGRTFHSPAQAGLFFAEYLGGLDRRAAAAAAREEGPGRR
jgi:hypothetical protein